MVVWPTLLFPLFLARPCPILDLPDLPVCWYTIHDIISDSNRGSGGWRVGIWAAVFFSPHRMDGGWWWWMGALWLVWWGAGARLGSELTA